MLNIVRFVLSGAVVICSVSAALAQGEDINRGKSPAQLFASDCAECHRNPRAVRKTNTRSLAEFLRVHYTASRESAAAIANYLISLGPDVPGGSRTALPSRPALPGAKPADGPEQTKPDARRAAPVAKPGTSAAKPAEPADEAKPAAARSEEAPAATPPAEKPPVRPSPAYDPSPSEKYEPD